MIVTECFQRREKRQYEKSESNSELGIVRFMLAQQQATNKISQPVLRGASRPDVLLLQLLQATSPCSLALQPYSPTIQPRQSRDGRLPHQQANSALFFISSFDLLSSQHKPHLQAIHLLAFTKSSTITLNMVAQTAAFKKAVEDSRKLKAKPNNDELLEVPASSPVLYFSAIELAHADTFFASSSTQITSRALAKTSPRPPSPAALRSRFVPLPLLPPLAYCLSLPGCLD